MQNIPRIYLDRELTLGAMIPLSADTAHYLNRVMRVSTKPKRNIGQNAESIDIFVFNNGSEFGAQLIEKQDGKKSVLYALCSMLSNRPDPSNNLTLAFAPIKQARLEEMINMATQTGVRRLQPVITERTAARHINWERIRKIAIEASEQSGRNSIPEVMPGQKFDEFLKMFKAQSSKLNLFFADERFANNKSSKHKKQNPFKDDCTLNFEFCALLIGPEGGFSNQEFIALDKIGAVGINLGKTILRAETAAICALAQMNVQSSKCNV